MRLRAGGIPTGSKAVFSPGQPCRIQICVQPPDHRPQRQKETRLLPLHSFRWSICSFFGPFRASLAAHCGNFPLTSRRLRDDPSDLSSYSSGSPNALPAFLRETIDVLQLPPDQTAVSCSLAGAWMLQRDHEVNMATH